MTEKYGDDKEEWPSLDDQIWYEASGGKKNGYFYGVPSLMDSTKLPGARKKYPVMGNVLSGGSNEVISYLPHSLHFAIQPLCW